MRRVIGVGLVVLAGLGLVFAISQAREAGRRQECQACLTNVALAVLQYANLKGALPQGTFGVTSLPPDRRMSWIPAIYPFTDYFQPAHFEYDPNLPWDSPRNLRPRAHTDAHDEPAKVYESVPLDDFPVWPIFVCPSQRSESGPRSKYVSFVGITGVGLDAPELPAGHPRAGVFGYDRSTRLADLKDGASNTLLLAETQRDNGHWLAGGRPTLRALDPARPPYLGANAQFGHHLGGANVAMADGSVRFVSGTIDPRVLEALATVAGGEPVPKAW